MPELPRRLGRRGRGREPASAFADTYERDARAPGADLTYAIDTRVHADHVSGVRVLAADSGAEAVLSEPAAEAAGELYDSLRRLLDLPNDTVIAPGHFSDAADPAADGTHTAKLGDLDASMDALAMDRERFVTFIRSDMPPRPANYEEVIATNLGREDRTDEAAFELELGPNNCAASSDAMTSN